MSFIANQIYLGQRGGFSIYGFGEAANSYFNKDVSSLTASGGRPAGGDDSRAESLFSLQVSCASFGAAQLCNAQHDGAWHAHARRKRKVASAAPLGVVTRNVEGTQAPYFVDMVKDQLLSQFSEHDLLSQSYRIYTTLDPDVQQAASACCIGGQRGN